MKIAIVGYGFVGKAVEYGFKDNSDIVLIDPKLGTSVEDLKGQDIGISFICLPTPMNDEMRCDTSILEDCVKKVVEYTEGIIAIKSTIIPSVAEEMCSLSSRVIYNPEFLREKTALEDFVSPSMHVFGGDENHARILYNFYEIYSSCEPCPHFIMTPSEASFVKYGINSFLMSKVLWFNQFYDIITASNSDYNTIINTIGMDTRIGRSHMNVPGHDGRRGAAGACFAKDGPAFMMYARDKNQDFTILEEILRRNQDYRNQYGDVLDREKEQNIKFDYEI